MKLHLSPKFSLPADAITQTFAIIAKRGVGKTYTAAVMAEEFIKAGLPVVVIDPIGVRRETFDSSSTPKAEGRSKIQPKLAAVDLEKVRSRIAETIERARAEDPRELRKPIAELEAQLKKPAAAAPLNPELEKRIRKEAARAVHESYEFLLPMLEALSTTLRQLGEKTTDLYQEAKNVSQFHEVITRPEPAKLPEPVVRKIREAARTLVAKSSGIEPGLRKMLIALTQRPTLTDKQVGVRAGMSSSSGTFGTYLGKARTRGWIEGGRDGLKITAAGRAALGDFDPLPTGRALLDYWLGELGGGSARMLQELAAVWPRGLSARELGMRSGLSAASGTFGTYLGKLRSLELVEGTRDQLRAAGDLFA